MVEKITEYLKQGETMNMVYMEMAKAFDTVPHRRLLIKLESYGINGKLLGWIDQFLTGRRQKVEIAGSFSKWALVLSGVPLRPVSFNGYINDLPE